MTLKGMRVGSRMHQTSEETRYGVCRGGALCSKPSSCYGVSRLEEWLASLRATGKKAENEKENEISGV